MNTQHLQYLIEIERTRSVSQAAENLFIGQPNLSRILHEMEANLGFKIFERTSKGVAQFFCSTPRASSGNSNALTRSDRATRWKTGCASAFRARRSFSI